MRVKILSAIGILVGAAISVFGAGATPISNLRLEGDANAADFYEVYGTTSVAIPITGAGADNWWSGQVVY